MRNTIKKVVWFKFHHFKDIETKLEKMAAKGLFLETCGPFLWKFRKDEPKRLKYTVTYFSEGSLFNPDITDNQQTYFDYAKVSGWDFVTQLNKMQIFCSEAENPVPFETDEREKFENIKKCMKKSFLPTMIALILVFTFNLIVQFNSFKFDPIDFLSDANRLLSAGMICSVVIYSIYSLMDYWIWCRRSDASIRSGGECHENASRLHQVVDIFFMCYVFGSLSCILFHLASESNWFSIFIGIVQMPILFIIFWSSIKYLKKKKASAMINRIVSFAILMVAVFAYMAFAMWLIIGFDFHTVDKSDYRTVSWEVTPTVSHDYRLYSDEIPLTCEDLYGPIDYAYYSYEETVASTVFLTKRNYRQDSLPAKDAPPRLEYEILKPQFAFVSELVKEHLLKMPQWRDEQEMQPMDNEIFGTLEAYQEYYEDSPTGNYILVFEDVIITLNMEEPTTSEQIMVIKEQLHI